MKNILLYSLLGLTFLLTPMVAQASENDTQPLDIEELNKITGELVDKVNAELETGEKASIISSTTEDGSKVTVGTGPGIPKIQFSLKLIVFYVLMLKKVIRLLSCTIV